MISEEEVKRIVVRGNGGRRGTLFLVNITKEYYGRLKKKKDSGKIKDDTRP